jgi:nicotinamidase-related amidase
MPLSSAFSSRGLPVVYTRHVNTQQDAGSLGEWWNDIIRPDDPLSEITDQLDTSIGSVVEKSQYDAMHGTGIERMLRDLGMKRVVITGVATHLCCETTARSAFVRGFQVTMPFDATATYDEDHHLASLLNLSHGFATITTVGDLVAAIAHGDE